MIENIFLALNASDWLIVILLLAISGFAFLYYFRTLPPLSRYRRVLAGVLRATILAITVLLILEPVLNLVKRTSEKPVIGVLVDNTASMRIEQDGTVRGDSLQLLLRHFKSIADTYADSLDVRIFEFGNEILQHRSDTLSFDIDGSNLNRALGDIRDTLGASNLQAIVLATDGIYNQGPNPLLEAERSLVPIHTILIGDTTIPRDLAIARLHTNQVTYVGNELPIEVILRHNLSPGQNIVVTISDGDAQVARQMVTLGSPGLDQKLTLTVKPDRAGDMKYTAHAQVLDEEITSINNQKSVDVRVLSSKSKVLVISGSPNYDRHFLKVISQQFEEYEVNYLTEQSAGRYYEGPFPAQTLDSMDLIVLHGYPTAITPAEHINRLLANQNANKQPILWFMNHNSDLQKLASVSASLPFHAQRISGNGTHNTVQLTAAGKLHPITRLDENPSANLLLWKELPPVEVFPRIKPLEGIQTLLAAPSGSVDNGADQSAVPVCYVYRHNERKQMVFNGADFGFWHFKLQEDPLRESLMKDFLQRSIRWLVNRDDVHRIQIAPLQKTYNLGEPVVLAGQVYDEFYNPLSDAEVQVTIRGDSSAVSDEMIAEGAGFYRQSISGLDEGEYTYQISAVREGYEIGNREGTLRIEPFNLEYQELSANRNLLRKIAQFSGGNEHTVQAYAVELPFKELAAREQFSSEEFFLWYYWHWLAILITLLALEWILRKRWGLL